MNDATTARLRFTAAMLAAPLLLTMAAATWGLWVLPELPDPMATHFAFGGAADGFTSPGTFIATTVGAAVATAVVFGALTMTGVSSTRSGRIVSGVGAGSIALAPLLMVAVAHPQTGMSDASEATLPMPGTIAAFVACGIVGVLVATFIRPPAEPEGTVPAAAPVEVTESTHAAWFGRGRAPATMIVILAFAVAATAIPAAFAIRGAEPFAAIVLGASAALVALVTWIFSVVRVRIDATGVGWSLGPGFPRGHVRIESIRSVTAVELKAADWGGWGYRLGGEGTAILLRGGQGLRINRATGKALFISVDDAARGAELAQAYLRRLQ
ncbi:DUF1648 domain-containing protein [Corynebacterium freneyi]|uniref:DUF1648 domain-containing protein n=1 Tax=Corynebacterium freneyi TaxID=134034 RepID=UPI00254D7709|nr:DUF1648 domain-containing protein [Corynebacterium freneyi]MDK8767174.1 DUF1648 domain-containing protein [Corynebacterium freneyi]